MRMRMRMSKCKCEVCKMIDKYRKTINKLKLESDRVWMMDFLNNHLCFAEEAAVDKAILDGTWPTAVEHLEAALTNAKKRRVD